MPKEIKKYWLMKSEPSCYSINDLKRDKKEPWDGIRNYQVRNMIRDDMKVGDMALFYHSNAKKETGVVGTMEITSKAYPDPTQFDPKSDHPDPKSKPENPRWLLIDVQFKSKFLRVITLQELKLNSFFDSMGATQKGNRLSIQPVSKKHYEKIIKMAR